jgi:hypothetical protein
MVTLNCGRQAKIFLVQTETMESLDRVRWSHGLLEAKRLLASNQVFKLTVPLTLCCCLILKCLQIYLTKI